MRAVVDGLIRDGDDAVDLERACLRRGAAAISRISFEEGAVIGGIPWSCTVTQSIEASPRIGHDRDEDTPKLPMRSQLLPFAYVPDAVHVAARRPLTRDALGEPARKDAGAVRSS